MQHQPNKYNKTVCLRYRIELYRVLHKNKNLIDSSFFCLLWWPYRKTKRINKQMIP
jgi:hypothetical protein